MYRHSGIQVEIIIISLIWIGYNYRIAYFGLDIIVISLFEKSILLSYRYFG